MCCFLVFCHFHIWRLELGVKLDCTIPSLPSSLFFLIACECLCFVPLYTVSHVGLQCVVVSF